MARNAPVLDLDELRRQYNSANSGGSGGNSAAGGSGSGSSGSGFSYQDYAESAAVQQARQRQQQAEASKPAAWTGGQWGQAQTDAVNAILNRDKFSYDMNSDVLYQQYKDSYINQGKLAMQDTMGQAAAMTGGYGNSYAATVGNQAYQSYLQKLNDRIPELYQMALDAYNAEGNRLAQNAQVASNMYNQEYGQYQDQLSQWNADRDYAAARYDAERNYDYSMYSDSRNFAFSNYQQQVAEDQWNRDFEDQKRQYDQNYAYQLARDAVADAQWQKQFEESQRQYNQNYAYQQSRDAVSDRQWNNSFSYQQSRDAVADSQWNKNFAENQRQFNATNATNNAKIAASGKTSGGGSGSGSTGGVSGGTKYKNGMTEDDVVSAVNKYYNDRVSNGHYIGTSAYSTEMDKWLKENGYSEDAADFFKRYLSTKPNASGSRR